MPKALTRDELQAQTRDLVLDAARRVFLDRGYHATSVAKIAEEAGRTQGSIYGNFASKEDLCLQILRIQYERKLAEAGAALMATGDESDKVQVIESTWRRLSEETAWLGLTAEFVLAVRHDPDQSLSMRETMDSLRAGVKTVLESQLDEEGVAADPSLIDSAVEAMVATGMGAAINQTLGTLTPEQSATVMLETIAMWRARLQGRFAQ